MDVKVDRGFFIFFLVIKRNYDLGIYLERRCYRITRLDLIEYYRFFSLQNSVHQND